MEVIIWVLTCEFYISMLVIALIIFKDHGSFAIALAPGALRNERLIVFLFLTRNVTHLGR
jgi:hypothetical protein